MTILASIIFGIILLYIGHQALSPLFTNQYFVIREISSTLLGDDLCNVKISAALINKTENPKDKETGIAIVAYKEAPHVNRRDPQEITDELIFPIDQSDIINLIATLKNGTPLDINLGNKKQLKITLSEDSNSMKFILNTSFLFRQGYLVKTPIESMNKLISGFESLLTTTQN